MAVDKRKERKNCEALAKRQNCTKPEDFSYHCVMNENEDAFIEVCAPVYYIAGKDYYDDEGNLQCNGLFYTYVYNILLHNQA